MHLPVIILDHEGNSTILFSTVYPYPYATVWRFKTKDETHRFIDRQRNACFKLPGFHIVIVFSGTLVNDLLDVPATLDNFAHYFLTERILPNASRFKRYEETE